MSCFFYIVCEWLYNMNLCMRVIMYIINLFLCCVCFVIIWYVCVTTVFSFLNVYNKLTISAIERLGGSWACSSRKFEID